MHVQIRPKATGLNAPGLSIYHAVARPGGDTSEAQVMIPLTHAFSSAGGRLYVNRSRRLINLSYSTQAVFLSPAPEPGSFPGAVIYAGEPLSGRTSPSSAHGLTCRLSPHETAELKNSSSISSVIYAKLIFAPTPTSFEDSADNIKKPIKRLLSKIIFLSRKAFQVRSCNRPTHS